MQALFPNWDSEGGESSLENITFLELEGAQINIPPCCHGVFVCLQGACARTGRIATIKKKEHLPEVTPQLTNMFPDLNTGGNCGF